MTSSVSDVGLASPWSPGSPVGGGRPRAWGLPLSLLGDGGSEHARSTPGQTGELQVRGAGLCGRRAEGRMGGGEEGKRGNNPDPKSRNEESRKGVSPQLGEG